MEMLCLQDLMDQKLRTYAERKTESKRKFNNNNQAQQIPKRQNVAQAYAIGTGERKKYAGTFPLCNKCKFHQNGSCTTKCASFKKGHYKSNCPELKNQNHENQAKGTGARGMVLELPQKLSRVHNTFYVLNLKKCLSDESLVIPLDELHVDDKLQFVEEPVEVMDYEIKQMRRSRIPIIKVRWNSKRDPEFNGNVRINSNKSTHISSPRLRRCHVPRLKP
nr:putative reverse transcriptase domain-containing protein [Tanacetum cinerariifolium]